MFIFKLNKTTTETCDHRPTMISNRTVIPTNSDDWNFIKLTYPVSSLFMSKGHKFLISIVHPDGNKTIILADFNLKKNRVLYKVKTGPRIFAIEDEKNMYKNEKLFFSIIYSRYHAKPGTYTVSLKIKDYLPSCEVVNITIKGSFNVSI